MLCNVTSKRLNILDSEVLTLFYGLNILSCSLDFLILFGVKVDGIHMLIKERLLLFLRKIEAF